jgi:pyridoxal phosphate enzyme (YggS family)
MSASNERLRHVLQRIENAESRARRTPGSVTLIAVSKLQSIEQVRSALMVGVSHFGENYVQEATKKIERIKILHPDLPVKWHLIGALQTNKSKFVVGKFETIQSIDRFELALALDRRAQEASVVQNILIQVKLGDEPTKGGVTVKDTPQLIEKIALLKNLRIEGLMSLPPVEVEAEASRRYFAQLFELKSKWSDLVDSNTGSFSHLSMGTSHDFEIAIEEGATMVRVGTAIFGQREALA